jgi:hypothetical protein
MCGKSPSRSQLGPSYLVIAAARQLAESCNTQLRMIVCTDQLVYVRGYG